MINKHPILYSTSMVKTKFIKYNQMMIYVEDRVYKKIEK